MTKIPKVSRNNVEKALAEIQRTGVPAHRVSTGYAMVVEDSWQYPPKLVLSLAVKYATGKALPPSRFSGGEQTNSILRKLGYEIIQLEDDDGPLIARLVIQERPSTQVNRQRSLLRRALTTQWPGGQRTKFFITPGGFFRLPFPVKWSGTTGWDSTDAHIKMLIQLAKQRLESVVREACDAALGRSRTDIMTIGIDIGPKDGWLGNPHAELVAIVDVKKRRIVAWTGKSYPTKDQERGLVQVTKLRSHFVRLAGERVLVLGCHDLNLFSPRVHANLRKGTGRHRRCKEMLKLVRQFKPTVVLQHPHRTDSARIWAQGWAGLRGRGKKFKLPEGRGIRSWASGIAYWSGDGKPRSKKIEPVLRATRGNRRRDLDIILPAQE